MHVKVTLIFNCFEDDCVSFDLHLLSVIEKGMWSCFYSYCILCLAWLYLSIHVAVTFYCEEVQQIWPPGSYISHKGISLILESKHLISYQKSHRTPIP
jgi:hypothetical protein